MQEYNIGAIVEEYELTPNDSHKSFYGKALVRKYESGAQVLFSYNTPVIAVLNDGKCFDLWGGWSATTGRHIRAFNGMDKAEVRALPLAVKFGMNGAEYIRERD